MTTNKSATVGTATTVGKGPAILKALGLPENTATIVLTFGPHDVVRVEATLHPTQQQLYELGLVFREQQQ